MKPGKKTVMAFCILVAMAVLAGAAVNVTVNTDTVADNANVNRGGAS